MKLSILIPTHNRRASLERALKSLAAAEHAGDCEIVVVASACSDDTAEWLAAYAGPLHVRSIVEPRPGVSLARNRGLDAMTGDAVLFLDDDVTVQPDLLKVYQEALQAYPEYGCFGGTISVCLEGDPPPLIRDVARILPSTFSGLWLGDARRPIDPAAESPFSANMAVRVEALAGARFVEALGRKGNGNLEAGEETLLFEEMSRKGVKTMWLPEARVSHWIHSGRQTMEYVREYWYQIGVMQIALGHEIPWYLKRRFGRRFAFQCAYLFNKLMKRPEIWLHAFANLMIYTGHEDSVTGARKRALARDP